MLDHLRFHHIGYAVRDIRVTAKNYTDAGWKLSEIWTDPIQNTKIGFLSKNEMPLIELVEPVDNTSPIVKTLDKVGNSTYHVCYEADDIVNAVAELRKKKYIPLFNPVHAVALNNRKICYLFNKDVGLIELVEK